VTARLPASRLLALLALGVIAIATMPLTLLAALAGATAVLIAVAVFDTVAGRPLTGAAPAEQ
jgi:hypothetical protein